ncbi:reverse transcriptase domain-containing protein, partial [Tanacetum coccineum]
FIDRFKSESSHIKGVPPVLRISAFMHGHGHPELAKKFNDKIPKMVDEMFERVKAFIRGEVVASGSSSKIMYEQGFKSLKVNIRSRIRRCRAQLVGFLGEMYHPLGIIDLRVTMGKAGRNKMVLMEFTIIKCRSPYNVIIGRTGMRSLEATPRKGARENTEEVFTISHERPNHYITMGTTLTANYKRLLIDVLRENIEVFVWTGSKRTVVSRFVMEHLLKIYPLFEPVVYKRRPMTPDRRLVLKEKVFRWLKEGMIRKVQHPVWVANTIPVKLANGTWKVQVDYSSLNKVCAKDMYPFPEEGEELASIMGYPYKCFLRLPKEYSQIRMAEDDEEKTGFHTEEGVYCFTHMPRELKNSAATLQRMMEKGLVQGVEETLRKLKSLNIKIDPITSLFGVKEGRFLGHMVTREGQIQPKIGGAEVPHSQGLNEVRNIRRIWLDERSRRSPPKEEKEIEKIANIGYSKGKRVMMLCLRQRSKTISSMLLVEREGTQIPVSYVSQPLQGMEICYTPTKKMVQALIHTTRSLRAIFRNHKVKVVTDGPMEEILKLSRREGRLAKWATKVRTYDISYIQRKEAEGSVVKKFFGQGEQVQETPDANKGGTINLSKKLQAKSTPTPRAWRLYLGKETIKKGLGVGIILVSPDEKMHSYVICLKFNASDHAIDCETLLAGLVTSVSKGMKDLHVFMDSPKLIAQTV